ncbi:hypothetical protein ANN_19512 [Periplaneta americana]|uniref:phospholipase A2 n=1 Tax=Periplaneta americana TaxID=6978 RepID=A0ABQ8SA36_PERAM|nr:hypothetical protein ANN_19512 [Periplaneta americana]
MYPTRSSNVHHLRRWALIILFLPPPPDGADRSFASYYIFIHVHILKGGRVAHLVEQLATDWKVQGSIPGGDRIFSRCQTFRTAPRFTQPSVKLSTGSFPGVKGGQRVVPTTPSHSSAEVMESMGLYLHAPQVPSWHEFLLLLTACGLLLTGPARCVVLMTDPAMTRLVAISGRGPTCVVYTDRPAIRRMILESDPTLVREVNPLDLSAVAKACRKSNVSHRMGQGGFIYPAGRQNVHDEESSGRPTIIIDDLVEQRSICLLMTSTKEHAKNHKKSEIGHKLIKCISFRFGLQPPIRARCFLGERLSKSEIIVYLKNLTSSAHCILGLAPLPAEKTLHYAAIERIPNLTGEQSDGITVFRIPPMTSLMLHRCRTGAINLQRWWQAPSAAISESDWFLYRAGISRRMASCTVVSWRRARGRHGALAEDKENKGKVRRTRGRQGEHGKDEENKGKIRRPREDKEKRGRKREDKKAKKGRQGEKEKTGGKGEDKKKRKTERKREDTKWCGPGDIAEDYDDLGRYTEEDKCCRDHDRCPDQLAPGQCLYGICNHTPFTM